MQKTVFVFPGQGAQYLGMGKDLYEKYDVVKDVFKMASDALDQDMKKLIFNSSEKELELTENTQPAVLTVSIAIMKVLKEEGINPDAVAGLSLGEYAALVTAGILDFKEAVKIVRKRGQFMQNEVPVGVGAMSAILALDKDSIKEACKQASDLGVCEVANYNCPGQIVIAGKKEAVEKANEICLEKGAKKAILLPVSAPFHTSMLKGAGKKLENILKDINLKQGEIPVVANYNAEFVNSKDEVKDLLVKQVSNPVLWQDTIEKLIDKGYNTFIEAGPGKSLSKFIKRVSRKVNILSVENEKTLKRTLKKVK
ncbi:MAG: ACP S-malonyltransferase [Bacillota bacterium]